MSTLYENFLAGTITNDPFVSGLATTIDSAAFASLPVVASPDVMYLVLDPEASAGAPEIVTVTAHTASATSVTVTRGSQSTTARNHNLGTVWRAAFTKADADQLAAIIADGAIGTVNLADASVTTAKLADASVTGDKIVDSSVTVAKIAGRSEFTATQTINATSLTTPVNWDVEILDDLSIGSVGTTALTIPSDGVYWIAAELDLPSATSLSSFILGFNGGTTYATSGADEEGVSATRRVLWFAGYFRTGQVIDLRAQTTSATVSADFRIVIQKVS